MKIPAIIIALSSSLLVVVSAAADRKLRGGGGGDDYEHVYAGYKIDRNDPTRTLPPTRLPTQTTVTLPEHITGILVGLKKPGCSDENNNNSGGNLWLKNPGGPGVNGAFCDFDAQDCPDGYKCTVEDLWQDQPRCRPLQDNPDQVGDECSELGNNDGDSCDVDGLCLGGVCRPLQYGGNNCPNPSHVPHIYPSAVNLCEEDCDPLLNGACSGNDHHCTRTSGSPDGRFSCAYSGNTNLANWEEFCVSDYQCQQGSICLSESAMPFGYCNNGPNCCVPLCDLSENTDNCSFYTGSQFTSCQSVYGNSPVPGLEHVGACVLG